MANQLPRTSGKPKEMHIVKIAVELQSKQSQPQLIKFDRRTPLTGIIQDLCHTWAITDHDNYALQFDQTNNHHFVTEKNRGEVKNGSILQLCHSPAKTAADFLVTLRSASTEAPAKCATLQQLVTVAADPTFAAEFINQQGFELIAAMIEDDSCAGELLKFVLLSFVELMGHDIVQWTSLRPAFIERQLYCVNNPRRVPAEAVQAALSNLENIVHSSAAPDRLALIEQRVTFEAILVLLKDAAAPVTQQNTLALVNALFQRAGSQGRRREIAAAFASRPYRQQLQAIVTGAQKVGQELAHQLYVLQTLTMGLLEARMMQPATGAGGGGGGGEVTANGVGQSQSPPGQAVAAAVAGNTEQMILELCRIAFQDDHHHATADFPSSPATANTSSSSSGASMAAAAAAAALPPRSKHSAHAAGNYKKLGFKCTVNPVQDFADCPPGMLALDCMLYFARNYASAYTAIVHENSCRAPEHECPFGRTAIELVRVLCDILRIGDAPNEQANDYCTMFFAHDHPFEETFCASVSVLHRTWKDMRATGEDFSKVFSVLREQITRTLADRPVSFEDFRAKIAHYKYATITQLRQQERTSKEACKSSASAIVSLKEKITPGIQRLIEQQRFNYLTEGSRFCKYVGSNRVKDKYWYARLSANHKVIHYGDCDEKTVPAVEDLSNKLAVADCRQLLVGREVPNVKVKKSTAVLSFSIAYENEATGTMKSLEFVAPDENAFDYWTDGVNALLGQPMRSRRQLDDLETVLSMEIELRLLDTEGVDISREPPPEPQPADNYDFCFES